MWAVETKDKHSNWDITFTTWDRIRAEEKMQEIVTQVSRYKLLEGYTHEELMRPNNDIDTHYIHAVKVLVSESYRVVEVKDD